MNKNLSTLFLLLISISINAQDLIILHDGQKIRCKITKNDSINLYFKTNEYNGLVENYINKDKVKKYYFDYFLMKKDLKESINMNQNYKYCASIGILMGGGSLVGVDLEYYVENRLGMQIGAGIFGFGGGINIHFKPNIKSSFLSLQYMHQGLNTSYTQSLFGPSFVFRGKRWFTAQMGLGFLLREGPAWPASKPHPPVMLTYAIGGYIPW